MMNCKEFAELLDVLPQERNAAQQAEMEQHIRECKECAALKMLMEDCARLDAHEDVPAEFTMGWRMKVRREAAMEQKRVKRQYWQKVLATAAAVVFVFGGATLSYMNGWGLPGVENGNTNAVYQRAAGGENMVYSMKSTAAYDTVATEESATMLTSSKVKTNGTVQQAKIIRTIDYTIKTTEFDADYEKLQQVTKEAGGYVESLSVSGDVMQGEMRFAYLTLRIPTENLDAFLGGAKTVGAATAYSEYSQDVSESYYDVMARLATQQAKLERLNALLEQATDVSDLIEIESAIGDTQYQIDRYMGQINNYDSRINNSYVYISLQELSDEDAAELPDVTFAQRVINAVKDSVHGMGEFVQSGAVFVVAALPWCLMLAVLALAVKLGRKVLRKK